jgi:hypothetical protein
VGIGGLSEARVVLPRQVLRLEYVSHGKSLHPSSFQYHTWLHVVMLGLIRHDGLCSTNMFVEAGRLSLLLVVAILIVLRIRSDSRCGLQNHCELNQPKLRSTGCVKRIVAYGVTRQMIASFWQLLNTEYSNKNLVHGVTNRNWSVVD